MGVYRLKYKASVVLAGIAAALGVFTLWRLVAAPEPRPEWLVHASAYPALSPEDLEGETPEGRARRARTHALLTKPQWSDEDVDSLLGSLASGVPDATFEQPQDRSKVLAVLAFDEPLDAIRIRCGIQGPSRRLTVIGSSPHSSL